MRQHLTAVANAESETIAACKKFRELIARLRMIKNGFCPAATGTEDITERESTTGDNALIISQFISAVEEIAHVYIDRVEARTHESCRHLVLTVYALLPENSNSRFLASNQRGGDIFGRIEVETNVQARILAVQYAVILFPRRCRIIAERLQPVTRLRPFPLHASTIHSEDDLVVAANAQSVVRIDMSNQHPCGITPVQDRLGFGQLAVSHLHYCAEFLVE